MSIGKCSSRCAYASRMRLAHVATLMFRCERPHVVIVLALAISACAFEQAGLPDSSFRSMTSNGSNHRSNDASVAPANWPSSPQARTAVDAEIGDGLSTFAQSGQQIPLVESTDALLAQHRSIHVGTQSPVVGMSADNQPINKGFLDSVTDAQAPTFSLEAVDAPIEALLFSLARDASVQLKVYGSIEGRVSLYSRAQPLEDIIASLAEQAQFSWQLQAELLSIWGGGRYSYSYPIDYLNISRRTQSSVGLATQVGTINASAESGSVANSSQTRVENTIEHHFWGSLRADIENMMGHSELAQTGDIGQFSINKEAGLLTLYAMPSVHKNIQRYLELLNDSSQRQVLIEATVVEVTLSDSFDAGVDWQLLAKGISGFSAAQVLVGAPIVDAQSIERIGAPSGLISFVHEGGDGDVGATLSLLEQFGDVRILSRPRIIALNNQSSVLKVVDNRVYFTVNVQRRQRENEEDEVITETEIHTVPVGLVMNVTPQITDYGRVMLNVRPTLSRILGFVNDPNPELALANVRNGVPEIQVREMESMLQVQSGEVAIIGGLMQETETDDDARLPGLGSLPGVGRLFSRKSRARRQTELLIVLRPTVIDNARSKAQR